MPGIISKLDYLNDGTANSLGIDAIWFSPFFTSPDHDFGYDIADYCDVDPRFGSLVDFDRLVKEAHSRDIRIMLDLVVNHTSHQHPWFLESRSSRKNPKRNWYIWRDGRKPGNRVPNNWKNHFYGSAWTYDDHSEQYYLHSFLKEQPDLNWYNPDVRAAIDKVIRFWLDRGVDGFRLDVAHVYCKDRQFRNNLPFFIHPSIKDKPLPTDRTLVANLMSFFSLPGFQVRKYSQHQPETHEVLKQFRTIMNEYPAKTSVGEILSDDPSVIASYYGKNNDQLHMNFYFEMLHCRWRAGAFRRCIERWERILPQDAWPAYTFSNHDVVRAVSRYGNGTAGNQRARLLMLMLLTLRGTPFIYYGEEIAMKEVSIPKNQLKDPVGMTLYPLHKGRDGCRSPMQWNTDHYAGFSETEPWLPVGPGVEMRNVDYQNGDPNSLLNLARRLIWLRKGMPALLHGSYHSITKYVPADCFCYRREAEQQTVMICLNFSEHGQDLILPELNGFNYRLLISTDPIRQPGGIEQSVSLGPYEGCLLEKG